MLDKIENCIIYTNMMPGYSLHCGRFCLFGRKWGGDIEMCFCIKYNIAVINTAVLQ